MSEQARKEKLLEALKGPLPFKVRCINWKSRTRPITVERYTDCDPLNVGLGTVYFTEGGWLTVDSLLERYEVVE